MEPVRKGQVPKELLPNVINYDCNGKLIEDMSKVVLSPELSRSLMKIIMRSKKRRMIENGNSH